MGGEGHMMDANNRLKENRSARRSQQYKRPLFHSLVKNKAQSTFLKEDLNESELESLKKEIRISRTRQHKKALIYSIVLTAIISLILYFLLL